MFPQLTQIITTAPVTGVNVFAIQILSNAVISSATGNLTGYAGVTLPAGAPDLLHPDCHYISLRGGGALQEQPVILGLGLSLNYPSGGVTSSPPPPANVPLTTEGGTALTTEDGTALTTEGP
jgi:hypothetical protein